MKLRDLQEMTHRRLQGEGARLWDRLQNAKTRLIRQNPSFAPLLDAMIAYAMESEEGLKEVEALFDQYKH